MFLVKNNLNLNQYKFLFMQTRSISRRGIENMKKDAQQQVESPDNIIGEFRVYEPFKKNVAMARRRFEDKKRIYKKDLYRYLSLPLEYDWTNVWPTKDVFKQSVIPLPVRQGKVKNSAENNGLPPEKYANAELMKIPNFLHLTPPHIKKHCAAIKKFCTPWPKELKTDEDCKNYFPIEVTTNDYIYDGPSIRDDRARVATLKISVDSLQLDEHAKHKFIKLAEDRYDKTTGILTLTSDKCPYKHQNIEYVKYLLTVLYFESWKVEDWESAITEADWGKYTWEKSKSKENITSLADKLKKNNKSIEQQLVTDYANNVTKVFDKGETNDNLEDYKKSVLKLFNINEIKPISTQNAE